MNPSLDALFDEPEKGYLKPQELSLLDQYVSSLPERIDVYRRLRSEERPLMQQVADQLQQQLPQQPQELLKRSLQNGLLALRYAAMAMLMDDPAFVTQRLEFWLPEIVAAFETRPIDETLYHLLNKHLSSRFTQPQIALLSPGLEVAKALIESTSSQNLPVDQTLVGLF